MQKMTSGWGRKKDFAASTREAGGCSILGWMCGQGNKESGLGFKGKWGKEQKNSEMRTETKGTGSHKPKHKSERGLTKGERTEVSRT